MKAHRAQSYRFRGGVARVAAWHGRTDVASLALHGPDAPSPRVLRRLLERLQEAGYREVVTNALGPDTSLPLVDNGFAVKGRLLLLAHDLANLPSQSGRTRRATRTDRDALLAADAAAFDEFWRFDALGLREAVRATRRSHLAWLPRRTTLADTGCSVGPGVPATYNGWRSHRKSNGAASATRC